MMFKVIGILGYMLFFKGIWFYLLSYFIKI